MGFDTYVNIDNRTVVSYRKQTGVLGRFLFDRGDLVVQSGTDGPSRRPAAVAFRCTVAASREVLKAQGLGWHVSVATYASVRMGIHTEASLWGRYSAQGSFSEDNPSVDEDEIERKIAPQRNKTPEQDLHELGAVMAAQWMDSSSAVLLFDDLIYDEAPPATSSTILQATAAAEKYGKSPLAVGRAVETIAVLFRDAPLAAWPMLMAVLLEHLPDRLSIEYVLSEGIDEFDMVDDASAVRFAGKWWDETGEFFSDYAHKLGSMFGALAAFENQLSPQFWFGQATAALAHLEQLNSDRGASSRKERGDALERLVETIVNTESPELDLLEKNFKTEEEEIDLLLRNGLPSPFWLAQSSPYVLMECKNWAKPIGVAELRVFESKIEDRRGMVRIGIFVSASGYAQTFEERLKVIQSRDVGTIFALTLDDLRGLITRREKLSDWLAGPGAIRAFRVS